jgi:hypothetical protein
MNKTEKRIRQELEIHRQQRDDARRLFETLDAKVRLLESLAGEAEARPAAPRLTITRRERTLRRLDAMATILAAAEPAGLGSSDLARRVSSELGEECSRGAIDDLLKRYRGRFERSASGDRWRPKQPGKEAAVG